MSSNMHLEELLREGSFDIHLHPKLYFIRGKKADRVYSTIRGRQNVFNQQVRQRK